MKGIVKLKFRDITGSNVVCSRILQSTQKVKGRLFTNFVNFNHTTTIRLVYHNYTLISLAKKVGAENVGLLIGETTLGWTSKR